MSVTNGSSPVNANVRPPNVTPPTSEPNVVAGSVKTGVAGNLKAVAKLLSTCPAGELAFLKGKPIKDLGPKDIQQLVDVLKKGGKAIPAQIIKKGKGLKELGPVRGAQLDQSIRDLIDTLKDSEKGCQKTLPEIFRTIRDLSPKPPANMQPVPAPKPFVPSSPRPSLDGPSVILLKDAFTPPNGAAVKLGPK